MGEEADLNAYKAMSMMIVFAIAFGSAFLPLVVPKAANFPTVMSLANVFAAGVFLTMGVAHLLPEAAESLGEAYGEHDNDQFKIAFMVCILGYTAILIVQRVIPIANLHSHSELGHGHSHGHQQHAEVEGAPRNKEAALVVDGGSNPAHSTERDSAAGSRPPSRPPFRSSSRRSASANGAAGSSPNLEDTPLISHSGTEDQHQYHHADQQHQEGSRHSNMRQSSLKIVALVSEGEAPAADSNGEPSPLYDQEHATQSKIRSYALLLALLLHNFASGLALGVQNNTKDVMTVFIALVAHKWAEGLTLGVSIAKAPTLKSKNKRLLLLFIFALGCPIGIAIGWAAEAALPASASGFLMALSAGTFLYIGASEVVAEEFATTDKGALKIFFFLLGCVCIFLTTAFAHSHGEHEGEGGE